jgi:hypothetical protein
MPIRNAKPVPLVPKGVCDAADGTNVPSGAMLALTNLVPDPSTAGLSVPRPAAIKLTDFTGFSDPGFVSCIYTVGDLCYGMIATSLVSGKDQPFIYDLNAGAFIAVTGSTSSNLPDSPNTTGPWTPPTMSLVSTYVIVTHPGFDGVTNVIGWFDISVPAVPTWHAGNTTTNLLPSQPVAVFNFNGRCYYALMNTLYFSDVLAPLTITNATDFITQGDSTSIIALSGLPLLTTAGGIVQSMISFKNATMFQVTGDFALNNLVSQAIDAGVGTFCPISITPTNDGLAFISPHGLRTVNQNGQVSEVIGGYGQGVSVPFINAAVPSRVSASFNVNTMRITSQNSFVSSQPIQEWWYNSDIGQWSGPHTFPASLIQRWRGSFVMTPIGITASLWQSDIQPEETSTYIENGAQLAFNWQISLSPDTGTMNKNAVVESSIGLAFNSQQGSVSIVAADEDGNALDNVEISVSF